MEGRKDENSLVFPIFLRKSENGLIANLRRCSTEFQILLCDFQDFIDSRNTSLHELKSSQVIPN